MDFPYIYRVKFVKNIQKIKKSPFFAPEPFAAALAGIRATARAARETSPGKMQIFFTFFSTVKSFSHLCFIHFLLALSIYCCVIVENEKFLCITTRNPAKHW